MTALIDMIFPADDRQDRTPPLAVHVLAGGDLTVRVDGHVIRLAGDEEQGLLIHADGVPPSVVARALGDLRIGHLEDYDSAAVLSDWRARAAEPSSLERSPVGRLVIARVIY